jgi:choline dehydrogenase-like flavoprotein
VSQAERAAERALAAAILPAGRRFRAGDDRTIDAALAMLRGMSPWAPALFRGAAAVLDRAALLRTARRFSRLDPDRQEALLQRWSGDRLLRVPLALIATALKANHYDDPEMYAAMRCRVHPQARPEPARWLAQVVDGRTVADGVELECDVVVVGTGAGGAVVGRELAERGHAVIFLEEGQHHRRDAFTGRAADAHRRFYRGHAGIAAVGSALIPVVMGRLVGGSTAINTATCWRTPEWICERWCAELGSDALSAASLRPHFERVERMLEVAPTDWKYLGNAARMAARGCQALGWSCAPVRRNARDCDGQGVCDYGCPTDGRRSMDLTYVPAALERGAQLYTSVRAERVIIEGGRAVGVEGRAAGSGARVRVRSRAVILAGGAIPTPLLLLGQEIGNRSGQVGRNLSLHPGGTVAARFDEPIEGYNAVPQGLGCDQFHREGMLLLGASAPLDVGALTLGLTGRRLTEAMESYDHLAQFGCMIEDEARGRVRRRRSGAPLITYSMTAGDVARLHRGIGLVIDMFRAAGARRFYPASPRFPLLDGDADIARFKRTPVRAADLTMMSFHPLGTCRMGPDPRRSVVGLDHQTHDLPGLYIVDGSTLPGPPAVNPQLTIMALATRAAGLISDRLG